jgi:RNA polymerase sigma-70 factor (ECF subfamily)
VIKFSRNPSRKAPVHLLVSAKSDDPLHLSGGHPPLQGVQAETVVRSGPDREMEGLYREHAGHLWRSLVAFTGDPEVASDAMAEAFAQALGCGDELREPLRWVWRVAFRVAGGELKDRGRRLRAIPPQVSEMDEPAAELVAALGGLSPNQRAVLVLHYYAGYATKEIAAIIGSSRATVRVHLSQGRKRLRRTLEEQGE